MTGVQTCALPIYLLGTTYGGNGMTTFGLPNLNGRVSVSAGQGPGLSNYVLGQMQGTESVSLTSANTPPHTHTISFSANNATATSPKGTARMAVGASVQTALKGFYAAGPATVALRPGSIDADAGGQPHENRQQFLVLNYIIAWSGVYPSQT